MRIIGIDPGYAIVGVGVVDYVKNKFYPVKFGAVDTPAGTPFNTRLRIIYDTVAQVIAETKPQCMSIEKLYFNMHEAKADWLYNLREWDGVLSSERRREITKQWRESKQFRNTEKKIGPNDPCPCGSGKKYKKCCGK